MQFRYRELEDGILLIQLGGEMDLAGTTSVEKKLASRVTGEKIGVILDLSEVTFLASIAVRLIITTAKSLNSRGGRLVILNPLPAVRDVLEITGVMQVIPSYSNLEDAVREAAGDSSDG
jgi:anti-anti-sigma factor